MNDITHELSGERLTLGKSSQRNQEDHTARYDFASSYIADKTVLDIACGTGYGTKMLKDAGAKTVLGVDIDPGAIEVAKTQYSGAGIEYRCASAADIQLDKSSFDVIVSFETIEHLESDDRSAYLQILHKALKPDGILLLSTPNKLITSPWSVKPLNPYHVLEYYRPTLSSELREHHFKVESWYGQRFVRKLFTYRLVYILVRLFEKVCKKQLRIYDIADGPTVRLIENKEPRYFVLTVKKIS